MTTSDSLSPKGSASIGFDPVEFDPPTPSCLTATRGEGRIKDLIIRAAMDLFR